MLSDPAKRKEYDEARALFAGGGGGFGGSVRGRLPGAGRGGAGGSFDMSDLFGRGGVRRRPGRPVRRAVRAGLERDARRPRDRRPARGQDVNAEVTLDFEQAVRGATLPLRLSVARRPCATCHGSGARPGTSPAHLPDLRGSAARSVATRAPSASASRAATAGAPASSSTTRARSAAGTGITDADAHDHRPHPGRRPRRRQAADRGQGHARRARRAGRRPVRHRPGPPARRCSGAAGDDLTLTVPITLRRGGARHDPARPDARRRGVAARSPPGTPSGRTLRVRGRGVTTQNGAPATCWSPSRSPSRRTAQRRGAGRARGLRRGADTTDPRPASRPRWAPRPSPREPHHGRRRRATCPRTLRCSSSRWRPSWPACTPRRCASTTGSGLVTPGRTVGGGRRYSARDVALLREVQRLSQDEGVNLAGHQAHHRARVARRRAAGQGRRARRRARPRARRAHRPTGSDHVAGRVAPARLTHGTTSRSQPLISAWTGPARAAAMAALPLSLGSEASAMKLEWLWIGSSIAR